MGDERAETYLRLRAEAELRRVSAELRRADAAADAAAGAAPGAQADPSTIPFGAAEMAYWKVLRAGRILVAAGVLDQDYLDHVAGDLNVAIKVRSRLLLDWDRRRGVVYRGSYVRPDPQPPDAQAMQVTPIGGVLRAAGDRRDHDAALAADRDGQSVTHDQPPVTRRQACPDREPGQP